MTDVYRGEAWLGTAPEIKDEAVQRTVSADIVVVGGGLAGVAAARRACEMGASVALLEKCRTLQGRSGDFAAMDSRVADKWGRRDIDKAQIVSDLMKDMCYKVSADILRRWAEEAGEAFDWYLEGEPDIPLMETTLEPKPRGHKVWLQPRRLPLPASFDNDGEYFKCYQVTVSVLPTHIPLLRASHALAEDTGRLATFYNTPVHKLLRGQDGRVNGVLAKTTGGYLRANAHKGVILATGDYMGNDAMLRRFAPGYVDTPQLWTSYDADKNPSNTGDGHRMGMWVGAKMQDAPAAPCAHHMGSVFGCNGFLLLNTRGRRFVNEDAPGQQIGSQIENLPDKAAWQIVDGDWARHLQDGYPSHGSVCYPLSDEPFEKGEVASDLVTNDNVVWPAMIERALKKGQLYRADALEELLEITGLPKDTALAEIARYNQMCENGKDTDYAKNPLRLWGVQKPPYYCARFTPATMIAVMGGLQSDADARCYDVEGGVIPGLYLAGNVQGNRVAVDYPLTVPGLSHSMALTYGRIAAGSALAGL